MTFHVAVDVEVCDSFGACVAAAPQVFDLDDDDLLVVVEEEVTEANRADIEDAVARCPKRALQIVVAEERHIPLRSV